MCGIVGIVSKGKAKQYENSVKESLRIIKHRGPDDTQLYIDDDICFGYVRLAIRGLSESYNQPIIDGDYITFANGEVYSINGGSVPTHNNDLYYLSQNLVINGIDIYDYIDSDFAICTYNKKAKTVILARDFYGVKPLFYSWIDDNTLAFASEIKALINLIPGSVGFSRKAIKDYLLYGYPIGDETYYSGIFKFPPKTMLVIDLKLNTKKFISYKKHFLKHSKDSSSILQPLRKAVETRLVTDRQIGSHLSGGFDSSLIAYIAKNKIDYITAYNTLDDNDLKVSNIITNKLKSIHTMIKLPKIYDYSKIISVLSSPIMSPGAFVPYEIARISSLYKKNVLLAGQGADELFLGYSRFKKIKSVNSVDGLFELLSNGDTKMLQELFCNFKLDDHLNYFTNSDFLLQSQEFYINNFLSELLRIEDAMHMNFSIENRVPFLSLPIRKFIEKNGICVESDINKIQVYKANLEVNSYALNRTVKENMNRSLKTELLNINFDNFFCDMVFDNLDYNKFRKKLSNVKKLNKKQLFVIWAIYNIYVWYKNNDFKEKIVV